jgi:hypothetical protein
MVVEVGPEIEQFAFEICTRPEQQESRPGESHPEPLAEPDVNLSAHPAPIKQTRRAYRYPSVRREPFVPWQAVGETGSPGPDGL